MNLELDQFNAEYLEDILHTHLVSLIKEGDEVCTMDPSQYQFFFRELHVTLRLHKDLVIAARYAGRAERHSVDGCEEFEPEEDEMRD